MEGSITGKSEWLKQTLLIFALGLIPVIWLGLLIAPAIAGGLPSIVQNLAVVFENPFRILWSEDSLKTVLIFVLLYGMGILMDEFAKVKLLYR